MKKEQVYTAAQVRSALERVQAEWEAAAARSEQSGIPAPRRVVNHVFTSLRRELGVPDVRN